MHILLNTHIVFFGCQRHEVETLPEASMGYSVLLRQHDLVHIPFVATLGTTMAQLVRIGLTKLETALPNGFIPVLDIHRVLFYTITMVATTSTMLALGTEAPPFAVPDVVTGHMITLDTFADKKAVLIMFICRHCKYVQHVKGELSRLGRDYQGKDIGIVAISANDAAAYLDDAPESLKEMAQAESFPFPYCYDETQAAAKAYTAACTPDFFLFDRQRQLVYRGQLDESRPSNQIPVTGKDLRAAIEAVLADQPINPAQKPSMGCNIKWKEGNEPSYFLSS